MGLPKYISTLHSSMKYRYCITGETSESRRDYEKACTVLMEREDFHELLEKHQCKLIILPNWTVELKTEWFDRDFYSKLSDLNKALWIKYYPIFEDYNLYLKDKWKNLEIHSGKNFFDNIDFTKELEESV